jgi:hypothetical protein
MLGVLGLASAPSLAAEYQAAERVVQCEMKQGEASCPMHEDGRKMECPMMDRDGHGNGPGGGGSMPQGEGHRDMGRRGSGADGHGALPQGDGKRAMGDAQGDCPMMGHSQTSDDGEAHAHGDQGTGEDAAPQGNDAHDDHAPG